MLVVDNLNTHGPGILHEAFEPETVHRLAARFERHSTPEQGSWLNIAECERLVLTAQCLDQRIPDADTLIREIAAWETKRNYACPCLGDLAIHHRRCPNQAQIYPVVKEQNLT